MYIFLILGILTSFIKTIWNLPLLLLSGFGIRLFSLSDISTINIIRRKIKYSSLVKDNKNSGLFFIRKCFGYIHEEGKGENASITLYILTTQKIYDELCLSEYVAQKEDSLATTLKIREITGNYYGLSTIEKKIITVDIPKEPTVQQAKVLEQISTVYEKKQRAVCFLHGKPGTKKSTVAYLAAEKFGGTICNSFNPTKPGTNFSTIHSEANPTKESPLIMVFDEVDIMLKKIHKNKVKDHDISPVSVTDKSGWDSLFDKFNLGYYRHTIFILTSNTSYEDINAMDKAYLREGRIDFHKEFN